MLILDEVKTGFRVAPGGAQQLYGIHADLTTYAKAMGNGYPVAAFGGRADVMDSVGSFKGGVVHGGTYTANLIALSGASATLDILANTDACKTIDATGEKVPSNYRDWRVTDSELYARFAWSLIDHGLMLEPDSREPWFICEAHAKMDFGWLEDVATRAMRHAKG